MTHDHRPIPPRRRRTFAQALLNKKTWAAQFAVVAVISTVGLLVLGRWTYEGAPPVADFVSASTGEKVVPVALMATVFARHPERELSALDLKTEVGQILSQLEAAGAQVYIPRRDLDYALTVGLRTLTLRRLVDEREGLYRARPAEQPLLAYYANSIAHLL